MTENDLTRDQVNVLNAKISSMRAYFTRLIERMNKRNFSRNDPLFRRVLSTSAAIHDLSIHVHYLS